jgi:hypothetical protein
MKPYFRETLIKSGASIMLSLEEGKSNVDHGSSARLLLFLSRQENNFLSKCFFSCCMFLRRIPGKLNTF